MSEVTRKVNLGRSLDLMSRLYPEEYDFHPRSWFLPSQLADLSDYIRRQHDKHRKPTFIVKPDEGSQGDGIYLLTQAKDYIFNGRQHIVQEYLESPLLLDDLKFDLRVYVVLKQLDPLQIYIYNEGLARFCTLAYEKPNGQNVHKPYMHLTNYSLNKHSSTYQHTDNEDDGSKRTMRSVFQRLQHHGYNTERIWEDIRRLVAKTLIAVAPELRVEYHAELPPGKTNASCFQILGFDVLITQNLKPKLLEVNSSPSLRIDFEHEVDVGIVQYIHSPIDDEIKRPLVMQALLLAAPRRKKRRRRRDPPLEPCDNDEVEEEEEEDEETEGRQTSYSYGTTTLSAIYPDPYACIYGDMTLIDRASQIFIYCLGVRSSLRMGPTAFRNFVRKCKMGSTSGGSGMTMADFDIMYIDLQRRWEHVNLDSRSQQAGLCYQGFLEALVWLSERCFPEPDLVTSLIRMLQHCQTCLDLGPLFNSDPQFRPGAILPAITKADKRLQELKSIYGAPTGAKMLGSNFYIDYKDFPIDPSRKIKRRPLRKLSAKEKLGEGETVGDDG